MMPKVLMSSSFLFFGAISKLAGKKVFSTFFWMELEASYIQNTLHITVPSLIIASV
jgi:hypothetical protein